MAAHRPLHAIRQPNEPLRLRLRELGIGATERFRRHPLAHTRGRDPFADGDHGPGALGPGRERGRERVLSLALIHLNEVDARRLQTDDGLARSRLGLGNIFQAQGLPGRRARERESLSYVLVS